MLRYETSIESAQTYLTTGQSLQLYPFEIKQFGKIKSWWCDQYKWLWVKCTYGSFMEAKMVGII